MNSVLLVEEPHQKQPILKACLEDAGYTVSFADSPSKARRLLRSLRPQAILLDLAWDDEETLALLHECRVRTPEALLVVLAPEDTGVSRQRAMRAWGSEIFVKPFENGLLLDALNAANVSAPASPAPAGLAGTSAQMSEIYRRLEALSRSSANVFITGEIGTGKETCARAIHANSDRSTKTFLKIDCGALDEDEVEAHLFSQLFGGPASGGTLLLDQVSELSPRLQARMLRLFRDPEGSASELRIVCATTRPMDRDLRVGAFREDLFYRLNELPLHLPPLRDRPADVADIALHALQEFAQREQKEFTGITAEALSRMRASDWPGNVRQLRNVIRSAVVLHDGPTITTEMLPSELRPKRRIAADETEALNLPVSSFGEQSLNGMTLTEIERLVIETTISEQGGSVPRAARVLGVSPSTLYRKREGWDAK